MIVGSTLKEAAKIITSFTVAHSIILTWPCTTLSTFLPVSSELLLRFRLSISVSRIFFAVKLKTLAVDLCIRVGSRLRLRFSPARNWFRSAEKPGYSPSFIQGTSLSLKQFLDRSILTCFRIQSLHIRKHPN
jgi:hypothetical protein